MRAPPLHHQPHPPPTSPCHGGWRTTGSRHRRAHAATRAASACHSGTMAPRHTAAVPPPRRHPRRRRHRTERRHLTPCTLCHRRVPSLSLIWLAGPQDPSDELLLSRTHRLHFTATSPGCSGPHDDPHRLPNVASHQLPPSAIRLLAPRRRRPHSWHVGPHQGRRRRTKGVRERVSDERPSGGTNVARHPPRRRRRPLDGGGIVVALHAARRAARRFRRVHQQLSRAARCHRPGDQSGCARARRRPAPGSVVHRVPSPPPCRRPRHHRWPSPCRRARRREPCDRDG